MCAGLPGAQPKALRAGPEAEPERSYAIWQYLFHHEHSLRPSKPGPRNVECGVLFHVVVEFLVELFDEALRPFAGADCGVEIERE